MLPPAAASWSRSDQDGILNRTACVFSGNLYNLMETHYTQKNAWCGMLCHQVVVLLDQFFRQYCDYWSLSPCPPRNGDRFRRNIFSTGWGSASAVLDVLNEHFDNRVLCNNFPEGFGYGWSWPPYSPNLSRSSYFLWGFLKDAMHKNNLHKLKTWNKKF
jgi:hypothetical protein